ncbi:MAG: hypothetical protein ACOYBY_08535 [Dermatophilaceae bacterium]
MPEGVTARVLARLAEVEHDRAGIRQPGPLTASSGEPAPPATGSPAPDEPVPQPDDEWDLATVLPFETVETVTEDRAGVRARRPRRALLLAGAAAAVGVVLVGATAVYRGATNDASLSASLQQRDAATGSGTPGQGGVGQTVNGQLVHFQMSGRAYTEAALTLQAQDIIESPTAEVQLPVADASKIGPVATPEGLTSCIATLGEADADEVAVDMATYAGQQAAVLVVVTGETKQVFAVTPSCSQGDPQILVGPLPMT